MNLTTQRILGKSGLYALVALISLFCLFPFYFAIVTSLKSGTELFSTALWPSAPSMKNYIALFTVAEQPFGRHILNSLGVSAMVVIASLFLGVTAAYALGRITFKGKGLLLLTILAVSMFPQVADAVVVAVLEAARVDLVDHPAAPPGRRADLRCAHWFSL